MEPLAHRAEPLILLDLDGVLDQERVLFESEERVRFCPAHGDWIRERAAAGELWLATGWGQ